jgi:hypothetical protein
VISGTVPDLADALANALAKGKPERPNVRYCFEHGLRTVMAAVKGKPPAAVLETLGLRRTGAREAIAGPPVVGAELPSGWYLVVADGSGHRLSGSRRHRAPVKPRRSLR